tara:strand:- start:2 stop:481 length:480 start_codon:yes stop_codon:yes gene_type:complete
MIFFRGLLILFLVFAAKNVMADNHSKTQQEIVDQAKEITKSLEDPKGGIEEEEVDDVPLNDPFAGNEAGSSANLNIPEEEQQDQMSLYNFKLSGLISGKDHSYISLVDSSGDIITLSLGQNLGKIKLIDLRLTEAIFVKEDKSFLIIDFNNQVREANEY